MSRLFILLIFILLLTGAWAQETQDILHYRFELLLTDASDTVRGRALIRVHLPRETNVFSLQLAALRPDGRGMTATAVYREGIPLRFLHRNDSLLIQAGEVGSDGREIEFEIYYEGIPADGLIISKNRHGDRTFFSDNWPDRAHQWIPCVDRPDDKASFEFVVTAPDKYIVVANGERRDAVAVKAGFLRTHWEEKTALSTKIMAIGVARFAVRQYEDGKANPPVTAWSYPQDSSRVFQNFSPAPEIVRFFSAWVAPFPFSKLANVQSRTNFGGMENAGAIFYDENTSASTESIESLLAHEIAHQWFGDMASEKQFAHLWLSEGFATYFTHLYLASRYGTDRFREEMKEDRESVVEYSQSSDRPVVDAVSPYRRLLNPNSYQKGGWILHMLRRQLGDSVFHLAVQRYYRRYAGGNATTGDFQQICQEVSGRHLDTFFHQWLEKPGQPRLLIRWKYESNRKRIWAEVQQLQPYVFRFPLDIELQTARGKKIRQTILVSKSSHRHYFSTREAIRQLVADPDTWLLYEGRVESVR